MLMRRSNKQSFNQSEACILHKQLSALESLATCMDMGWMAILVSENKSFNNGSRYHIQLNSIGSL